MNYKSFGAFLMAVGIVIFGIYYSLLFVDEMLAIIAAVTIMVSMMGIMFFWLGAKVLQSGNIPKEEE